MRRVVVTGGSGLVGRHIVRSLMESFDVVVLDLKSFPDRSISHRKVDVLNLDALVRAVEGCDAVIHLAGIPHPLNDPPDRVFHVNTVGTLNVLEACSTTGVGRVVFMSSESTLGIAFGEGKIEPDFVPIDETHTLRAQDPYGLSKMSAELICEAYSKKSQISVVSLRAPWIWVPDDKERARYGDLVKEYRTWRTSLWSHIHVLDVAAAIRCALDRPDDGACHRAYFISSQRNWTGKDTRELVREFFPGTKLLDPNRMGPYSLINAGLAERELQFTPKLDPLDILNT